MESSWQVRNVPNRDKYRTFLRTASGQRPSLFPILAVRIRRLAITTSLQLKALSAPASYPHHEFIPQHRQPRTMRSATHIFASG
jgi:hypothetical protein